MSARACPTTCRRARRAAAAPAAVPLRRRGRRARAGRAIRARCRVTGDEPFLAGHFPGNPIFPGVLQLEALAQAGAIAVLGRRALRGQASAVRRGRGRAVPAPGAPGRRARSGRRHRAAERAWRLGPGGRVRRGRGVLPGPLALRVCLTPRVVSACGGVAAAVAPGRAAAAPRARWRSTAPVVGRARRDRRLLRILAEQQPRGDLA